MQTVIEPQMVTLAGGMSLLYYDAKTKRYHYLDAELEPHQAPPIPRRRLGQVYARSDPRLPIPRAA
jgi:gamma-glutamyltranspeptidase